MSEMPKKQMNDQEIATVNKAVKKKRDWVANPKENFGEENVKPGENSRYLRYAIASRKLPPIDISDPKQVEQRIDDYFMFCIDNDRKPTIKGVGNWIGAHRDTVNSWMRGEYRASTHSDIIKKAVDILEELWQDYMQNGKINPVSGIFLGKIMFGYKDVQDVVLTPPSPLGAPPDISNVIEYRKQLEAGLADD